jgi:predicted DNA-binding transcriptional regulator AlpA
MTFGASGDQHDAIVQVCNRSVERRDAGASIIHVMTSWPKREQVDPADLIGAREVLEETGWRARGSIADAERKRDFPPPVAVIGRDRLWHRQDVRRWLELNPRQA